MKRREQFVFLGLILSQAAHSVEEYVTRLYDVFAPARFVSSLVSGDLGRGFLIANAVLVGLGLLCWAVPVRLRWRGTRGLIWFWTILELGNGMSHSALASWNHGYFPGLLSAPLLLFFAGWLALLQVREASRPAVLRS